MVATKFYYKYHVVGFDRLGNPIDNKYKSIDEMLLDCDTQIGVYTRQQVYKVVNEFHKKELPFKILKIKEALPTKTIVKKVLITE
jgi:hypothetical protein